MWPPTSSLFKLDLLSVKTVHCSWFTQADIIPPCMVHLYFTFPQDTLTRSTKLICRTLVMVHMLARRHPSGPSWSKPQSTKNTSFYRKPLSYCNNLQLSIRLLWCPPQNKTSTTPANKIFNDAFMLLRSKPVLPNQN